MEDDGGKEGRFCFGGEVPLTSPIGESICRASEFFIRSLYEGMHTFEAFLRAAMTENVNIRIKPPPLEMRKAAPRLGIIAAYSGLVRWQPLRCGIVPPAEGKEPDKAWAEYDVTARLVSTGRSYDAKEVFVYTFVGPRLFCVAVYPEWERLVELIDEAETGAQLRIFQSFYSEARSGPGPTPAPGWPGSLPRGSSQRGSSAAAGRRSLLPPLTNAGQGLAQYGAPCPHNNWQNKRAKRGWIMLLCKDCGRQWKVGKGRPAELEDVEEPAAQGMCRDAKEPKKRCPFLPYVMFCDDFRRQGGCPLGHMCSFLHIVASDAVMMRGGYPRRDVPPEEGSEEPVCEGAAALRDAAGVAIVRVGEDDLTKQRSGASLGLAPAIAQAPLLANIQEMIAAVEREQEKLRLQGGCWPATADVSPEELRARFRRIAAMRSFYPLYRTDRADPQGTRVKLRLYGWFKQATVGDAPADGPPAEAPADARAKWAAWNQHRGKTQIEAMHQYIEAAAETFPPSSAP
eukprot:TRINITY_DN44044_c0_g1_i1.p1 TRINITY_DN44044_c0_g1~~TRINITY_DN44044_c0_g1_i1.p1  ORF type:complete len:534 (+),score=129.09 TRINITY_DN44044_c0_g1_i1:64-1602(+)